MTENNKRIALGVVVIILIAGVFSAWNKKNTPAEIAKNVAPTQIGGQTEQQIEELKLRNATNDAIVDFFVDGLTQEELITTIENIDNSFTPYTFEATGVITTSF